MIHRDRALQVAAILSLAAWVHFRQCQQTRRLALAALGRVVGGSRFPRDVAAGAILGLLAGWWLTHRLRPVSQPVACRS
ncbi:MAG: hypothetical protein ACOZHQ_16165 [Thermodesulfobacteriota bacterium]